MKREAGVKVGVGGASEFIHQETGEGKTPTRQVVQESLGPGQPRGPSASGQ